MKLPATLIVLSVFASAMFAEEKVPADTNPALSAVIQQNEIEGKAFLDKNAKAPGIVVLPSGLQYRVMDAGTGEVPTTNNLVFIKYQGRFIDGSEFDHHNRFLTWTTGGIKGWQEALQKMHVGAKWRIFVPPTLGFGDEGEDYHHIGPRTTLIYDLELLSIAPPNPELATGGLGHALEENPSTAEPKAEEKSANFK
jgi:FKBP-type peptidyl-prolyl cis-trans isomerase